MIKDISKQLLACSLFRLTYIKCILNNKMYLECNKELHRCGYCKLRL